MKKEKIFFSCFTLENGGTSTHISGTDRRILAGEYYLRWTSSSTNSGLAIQYDYWKKENHLEKIKDGTNKKNIAVWVMSNTIKNHNKRRILIHIGNSPQDTLGCILCGYINGNNGKIGNSTKAINDLFLLFEKYGIEKLQTYYKGNLMNPEDLHGLVISIAQRVGLNKDGNRNGNGLITEVEEIEEYINVSKTHQKEIDMRLDIIDKDIKEIKEDIKYIKNELKDNINMRSFINTKNILSGMAQVITNLTVIGGALYFILKTFFERG
ncbi:DUF5675 family protein [Brachyspira pilosicoli]|uniref:DUF5675 family protein n=2 Tax=Brachyspiraceae TaxID=143786 RepID=UPI000E201A1E|nr:DUF5675 family protein [Brachyspira pilosicoli]